MRFFTLILLLLGLFAQGQFDSLKCGTVFKGSYADNYFNNNEQRLVTAPSLPDVNRTLIVTPWIVLDSLYQPGVSEAAIQSQITTVNSKLAPINLSLTICEFRYIENYRYDLFVNATEEDELTTLYNEPNTINMYFVQVIVDMPLAAGYAYMPGGKDVIVITKGGLSAMPHEVGHFLGLPHTFEGGNELVERTDCYNTGDGFCDTEADPYNSSNSGALDANCNYKGQPAKDSNGDWYVPPVTNIMSYWGCECEETDFTFEQLNKIADVVLNIRNYLW